MLSLKHIPEHNFIRNAHFQKTIAAYRSGYIGALSVAFKMPIETHITNADFRFRLVAEHSADIYTLTTDKNLQLAYSYLFNHLNPLMSIHFTVFS